jgi:hypothetical protein
MLRHVTRVLLIATSFSVLAYAQCAKDNRSDEHGGVVVTDFTINGTTTLNSTELARLSGEFVGSCHDDDSEEMQERLRAGFQERGYFAVEVKHLTFKPSDPLGSPKPVAVEADVVEGPKYRLAKITFLENHALSTEALSGEFPLKPAMCLNGAKSLAGLRVCGSFTLQKAFWTLPVFPTRSHPRMGPSLSR